MSNTFGSYVLDIEITCSNEATIAVARAAIDGKVYDWTGTAKRCPEDKFNPEVGAKLAIGRALEKAGRQLQRQGDGLVKSLDDNRKQALEAKKRGVPAAYRVPNPKARRAKGKSRTASK